MGKVLRKFLEQIVEVPVPQVAEQFIACFVAVPVCWVLKDILDVSFVLHVQTSEWICRPVVEAPCPEVAEQLVALFVAVPVRLRR